MNNNLDQIAIFDMDGTLCDHDGRLKEDYSRIKSPNDPELKSFDDSSEPYVKERIRLIRNQPGWWRNLNTFQPGFDILEIARDLGFYIEILTKGPGSSTNAYSEKKEWAEEHIGEVGVDIDLSIVSRKSGTYGKVLVDDYPDYLESWLDKRPRGIGIMPAQSYNENFKHPQVLRYNGENPEEVRKALTWARDRVGPMPKFN